MKVVPKSLGEFGVNRMQFHSQNYSTMNLPVLIWAPLTNL